MSRDRSRWAPTLPPDAVLGKSDQHATVRAIMADTALTAGTKNTAWALCQFLNWDSGWTYVGLDRLAAAIGMRRGDMQRHLAALEGGVRPVGDRHAPKRSAQYVHSVRFGQGYDQVTYRCFLETQQVRNARQETASQVAA